jgi:DNA-binding NtrC family response regulator
MPTDPKNGQTERLPAILLVDDDPDVLDMLAEAVEREGGARVLKARSTKVALQVLQDHPEVVLVVTDQVMPSGPDGIALLEAVRRARPGIRRVLMTGVPDLPMLIGAVNRAGIQQYLPKAMSPAHLVRNIYAQLDAARGVQAPAPPTGSSTTPLHA